MQIAKLREALGKPQATLKHVIGDFLDSWQSKDKSILKKDTDEIHKIISELRRHDGFQPQVTKLVVFQSEIFLAASQEYLAAKCLLSIDFNSQTNGLSYADAIDLQLNICEYFIKVDDTSSGMNVYLKLKGVKWEELKKKTDANRADFLYLRFKLIEAEYLKENNHSIDAAVIYDNAIRNPILKEFPQQLEELSDKAVIAALFAPSGQRRTGVLANISQTHAFKTSKLRSLLEKLMNNALIFNEDVQLILPKLRDWQKREDLNHVSPVEYTVFEHNLICLAQVYDVVSINTLKELLKMSEMKVLMLLERMIKHNKLQAEIEAVGGFVTFTQNKSSENNYNERIMQFCSRLQHFIEDNKPQKK